MRPKKSKKANLEGKRGMFFQAGLIITMGLTLLAFEWYSPVPNVFVNTSSNSGYDDVELVENTFFEEKKVLPPKPVVYENIMEMPNDFDDGEFEMEDFIYDNISDNIDYIQEKRDTDIPYIKVEEMPKYKGGNQTAFWRDVNSRLTYPQLAQEMGLEGTVYVSFIVDRSGQMTDIKIIRSDESVFNNEVLRVLKESDIWTPGKQLKKPVKVSYTMAFKFKFSG